MTAGCNCGRKWDGLSQAHCTGDATGNGCHRHFGSVSGFDDHRRTGRCVDPATLLDREGRPRYKTVTGPHGQTWSRNNPRGNYWSTAKPSTSAARIDGTPVTGLPTRAEREPITSERNSGGDA